MNIAKKIIFVFLLLGIVAACSDDPCNLETDSFLTLGITVDDTALTNADFTGGLFVFSPEWTDSVYYDSEKIDSITLSPNNTITTFVLASNNETLKDTLWIYHQNTIRLLSMECGFVIDSKIDSVENTWNLIDSVAVVNEKITNEKNGLIEIYYF